MKQLTITALAGALLVLAGCMHTELDLLPGEEGIRITLSCGEIGTRTTYPEALEGEGNENLINTVDYFLLSSNSDYSTVIYSGHLEPKVAGDFTFYIKSTVANEGSGTTYKVFTIVNLPESLRLGSVVNGKFVWSDPLSRSTLDGILLDEASAGTFASVTTADGRTKYKPAGKDLSLVMTGESEEPFTVSNLTDATPVPIDLDRLPAKVTMEFSIKDKIVRNEKGVAETWTPMTDGANVRAYLCNGAKSIFVGESAPSAQDDAAPIFNYQPSVNNVAIVSEKEGYSKAFRSEAFYSYPRKWNQGDKDEPFVKLIIPWKVRRVVNGVTTESQKEFYYKVMLPSALAGADSDKGFVKNNWYRLFVDVDRLGSATDDASVTVQCGYSVIDWGDQQDFNLNMVDALYLDVNEGKYEVVFYGDKLELPFFSSGNVSYVVNDHYYNVFRTEGEYTYNRSSTSVSPATITTTTPIEEWQEIGTETVNNRTVYIYNANGEDIRITGGNKDYYSLASSTISYNTGAKHEFGDYIVSVSNEEKFLTIDHELKVNYTNRLYDISPYIYEITLMLDGHEGEFDKKLKVTQYPSLYLDKVRSGNWPNGATSSSAETVFINGYSFNQTGTDLTNVGRLGTSGNDAITSQFLFVSNYSTRFNRTNSNAANYWGNFIGTLIRSDQITDNGGNTNPYIFEVNATILQNFALEINGASVDAVIGDPRVPEGTTSYELPDGSSFVFGLTRLTNYRPTANDTKNVISPKFRIASSFGRTRPMTYEGAMRRCAAYQENGYPAGRWRLPTMAEIQFVMRLYGDKKIDMLFDPDNTSAYWAGSGMARFGKGFILGDEVFVDMKGDNHVWTQNSRTNPTLNQSPYTTSNTGSIRYDICEDTTPTSSSKTSTVYVYTRCVYDTWYWGDEQYPGYNPASPSWLGFQTQAPTTN